MLFFPQVSQKKSLEGKAILLCQFSVTIWDTTQDALKVQLTKKNKLRDSSFQAASSPQQAGGTGSTLPVNESQAWLPGDACQVQSESSPFYRAVTRSQQASQNSSILAS